MATPYQRGTAFEHRVKRELEAGGWFVLRSPASKSPLDLLAIRSDPDVWAVQCKLNGKMSPAEREELYVLAKRFGMTPIMAYLVVPRGAIHYRNLHSGRETAHD